MNATSRKRIALMMLLLPLLAYALSPGASPGQAKEEPQMTVYFANWNVYSSDFGEVRHLPWQRLDAVNHAFWKIVPQGGQYALSPTDARADLDASNPKAHFPQYEKLHRQYPQVDVLLSIGGWTCSGFFSAMCLTRECRKSFIDSCLEFLDTYPFFSGLDLDWEYPGVPRQGSGSDEGNPVKGDDKRNFTLLLRELRAALDARFGKNAKKLTICAAASEQLLSHQDYEALHPYVDRINLMTYDMTGVSSPVTGHHSPLYGQPSADSAVRYLRAQGVPAGKIAIGSPLYSHGWKSIALSQGDPLGAAGEGVSKGGTRLWRDIQALESKAVPVGAPGWHAGYDENAQAAYLWNDDPASADYRFFLTYESSRSLDAKLQYIRDQGLGGLIVWQSGGDDLKNGAPMLRRMYEGLHW